MDVPTTLEVGRLRGGVWTTIARAAARMRSDLPLALLDLSLAVGAYSLILAIRFDGQVPPRFQSGLVTFLAVAAPVHLGANWVWGLYGQMWRHASVQEARRIVLAGLSASLLLLVGFLPGREVPLSVLALGAAITTMLAGAVRFQSRLFAFRRTTHDHDAHRVVVIGAGETGAILVRDMLRYPDMRMRPVAVLDDDPRKQGRELNGVPVTGGIAQLPEVVRTVGAQEALLAIPSADGSLVRTAVQLADLARVPLKTVPSVGELVNGQISMRDVRDLRIDDLLGRSQIKTDLDAVGALIAGRTVLITGAGGSIGSEIARQVAARGPASLVLLDHDETHLFDVAGSLDGGHEQVLADIRDPEVIDLVFARHRPEVVFHAAAHKHVPILETHPCEAIRTNVIGTANVADAAVRHGVERFVLISTDKAVRPSSVMGASKRLAEQIVLSRSNGARFCAVRFGNVLGSRGSVVPHFIQQIQQGGPVTVTDARMTRYFMTIPEAVQLVLQAATLSCGGEIFMLDMGEPVRIMELAERMIRLSGRRVGTDIPIRITGARPGEKLAEELHVPELEEPHPTAHPSIVAIEPPVPSRAGVDDVLSRLSELAAARDEATASLTLLELAHGEEGPGGSRSAETLAGLVLAPSSQTIVAAVRPGGD